MKILIIEDERQLSDNILTYLASQGYTCEQAFTWGEARLKACSYDYDCVLLDLMLPGGDGLDILREVRRRRNNTGIIIISAKGALGDKLKGLELGADDYLAKPFPLPELSMRVYALIRRKNFEGGNILRSGRVEVDLLRHAVCVDNTPVPLTKTEYDLLLFFLGNQGRVIAKSAIAEHLSGEMADLMDNFDYIYSHIKNLKAKLARYGCKDCIKTIYGTGYKWDGQQ